MKNDNIVNNKEMENGKMDANMDELISQAKIHIDCLNSILPSRETREWLDRYEELVGE